MMVLRPGQFRQSFRGSAKKQKRQERNDSPIAENANEGEDEQQPSRTASEAEGRPDEVSKHLYELNVWLRLNKHWTLCETNNVEKSGKARTF